MLGQLPLLLAIASVVTIPTTSLSMVAVQTGYNMILSGPGAPISVVAPSIAMASISEATGYALPHTMMLSSAFTPFPAKLVAKASL